MGAKAVVDRSLLGHNKDSVAHIFHFEVSACLGTNVPIFIDGRPQDDSFVERVLYILCIHAFFVICI